MNIQSIIGAEQQTKDNLTQFKLFCTVQKIKEYALNASSYLQSNYNINIPVQFSVMAEFNQMENGLAISAQHSPLFIWSPWGRIQMFSPVKTEKKYLLFLRYHTLLPLDISYIGNEKSKKRQEKATFYYVDTQILDSYLCKTYKN